MLVKGDVIKQVKRLPGADYVGTKFKIIGIDQHSRITLTNDIIGTGIISYDEYKECFEKITTNLKPELSWTTWMRYKNDIFYRTNGKRVEVKGLKKKASCSCHPDNKFDIQFGIELATARLFKKAGLKVFVDATKRENELIQNLEEVEKSSDRKSS
jgi:hypothetical protein